MNPIDDATRRQLIAADPGRSTWLSANAGSGKTRVLTDRVARLLLGGVEPQHILCLTYTKAAASEMQNRLFKRLGAWAMLDNAPLESALLDLGIKQALDETSLRRARTLFARAIETPGGLKIQTIHSFCGTLLRRFPLEAGVSPQFTEIEDRASDLLRAEIIEGMADGQDAELISNLARLYNGEDFVGLTREILNERASFSASFDRAKLMDAFNLPTELTGGDLISQSILEEDISLIQTLVPVLMAGGKTDQNVGVILSKVNPSDAASLTNLETAFLTKSGTLSKRFPTKKVQESAPTLMDRLFALMERVETARNTRLALATIDQSEVLHSFARRFLDLYASAKEHRALLDFDDLIERARALLSNEAVAAWVLFRIDGGIDHILVDEAQDTSPSQWDVIRKLAEEFAAGEGARSDVERTIFVVGDQKQSIYSFQGADPDAFDAMRDEFDRRLEDSGSALQKAALEYSFRSSPVILNHVDSVFEDVPDFPSSTRHIAFHNSLPGRVDIWPVVPKMKKEADGPWYDPVDRKSPTHHHRVLAQQIAEQITKMLSGTIIPTEARNGTVLGKCVEPRDILILVRRRTGIFQDIIRACKEADLPIAGSDRLRVGAEVAVKDIGALLSFLATPDDDLSLATALRSPLFGWTEQELFTLAHHRGKQRLWEALRLQEELHGSTIETLQDLRKHVDILRPFDLIERVLTRHEGRKKLLGRLGNEAEDGIDALLTQALAYERSSVPSLTGFLVWMETDDLTIKRQIDSASNQIRIMTVHGAKGLEAPIVILPECGPFQTRERGQVRALNGQGVWRPQKEDQAPKLRALIDAEKSAQSEEDLRLLYVALTRAEKWLIIAASGDLSKEPTDWYQRCFLAAQGCGATETTEGGLRQQFGNWETIEPEKANEEVIREAVLEPFYSSPAPPTRERSKTVAPSELEGTKALSGEGLDTDTAKTYGTFLHLLLERLPLLSPASQQAFVKQTAQNIHLPEELVETALAEASRVHSDPAFQHIFAENTLSEVPISFCVGNKRFHGTIDRLVVDNRRIMAVDFKSNRQVPGNVKDIPSGILRQLGAYAEGLSQVYPNHSVRTAILWTAKPVLMEVPHDIVTNAFYDPRYLDAPARAT